MSAFWDRFLAFILISVITALLWLTLGAVMTLACLSLALLLLLFYYERQLAAGETRGFLLEKCGTGHGYNQ